ncbi:hypothetical protein A2U01_0081243 [Trifolium medium]|uniref:Uncharacterized protein n=1 Tax=Trifolium medium TaxID=97028 RepID=A0A392TG54_9FABA|nr:hypothetical protein [Trifolium medium]
MTREDVRQANDVKRSASWEATYGRRCKTKEKMRKKSFSAAKLMFCHLRAAQGYWRVAPL